MTRHLLGYLLAAAAVTVAAQQPLAPMSVADPDIAVATIKASDPAATDELFTIRGRHILTVNTPVLDLLKYAYGLNTRQIIGLNENQLKGRFDIDAIADAPGIPSNLQMQAMVRKLLITRFHLAFHREQRETAVFALTVSGTAPTMQKTRRSPESPTDFYGSGGVLNVNNATMHDFATGLSRGLLDRPVIDRTGLKDHYDFVLRWTFLNATPAPNDPPDLASAIREQLGLKLQSTRAPVEVLVIDTIQPPSEN